MDWARRTILGRASLGILLVALSPRRGPVSRMLIVGHPSSAGVRMRMDGRRAANSFKDLETQRRLRAGSSKVLHQQASETVVASLVSFVYQTTTLRISSISRILWGIEFNLSRSRWRLLDSILPPPFSAQLFKHAHSTPSNIRS